MLRRLKRCSFVSSTGTGNGIDRIVSGDVLETDELVEG